MGNLKDSSKQLIGNVVGILFFLAIAGYCGYYIQDDRKHIEGAAALVLGVLALFALVRWVKDKASKQA